MKKSFKSILMLAIMAAMISISFAAHAKDTELCEVDIENDDSDADDVCVTRINDDSNGECHLQELLSRIAKDGERRCKVDHKDKFGAFIFFNNPTGYTDTRPSSAEITTERSGPNDKIGNQENAKITTQYNVYEVTSDGSDQFKDEFRNHPVVLTGYVLMYTKNCLGHPCKNPNDGNWEESLLNGSLLSSYKSFDTGRWDNPKESKTDDDPVIKRPNANEYMMMEVELKTSPDPDVPAFYLSSLNPNNPTDGMTKNPYMHIRYINMNLSQGSAFNFSMLDGGGVTFDHAKITFAMKNEADAIFIGSPEKIIQDPSFGYSGPVYIDVAENRTDPVSVFRVKDENKAKATLHSTAGAIAFASVYDVNGNVSILGWEGADDANPVTCTITPPEKDATTTTCRLSGGTTKYVRLTQVDGTAVYGTPYTVSDLYTADGGVISDLKFSGSSDEAKYEAIFTESGRRIKITQLLCPDEKTPATFTEIEGKKVPSCAVANGKAEYSEGTGGFTTTCDALRVRERLRAHLRWRHAHLQLKLHGSRPHGARRIRQLPLQGWIQEGWQIVRPQGRGRELRRSERAKGQLRRLQDWIYEDERPLHGGDGYDDGHLRRRT